jgi:signal peptidase I
MGETVRQTLLIIIATFAVGLVAGGLLHSIATSDAQAAAVPTTQPLVSTPVKDLAAPGDHIAENAISVLNDQVDIKVSNPVWARFTPTGSMKPVFDEGANAIEVVPQDPSQVKVGDIISYKADWLDQPVVHRVIETGNDAQGWYAVMKGDNNSTSDPGKVRWNQVLRLVVAIIY